MGSEHFSDGAENARVQSDSFWKNGRSGWKVMMDAMIEEGRTQVPTLTYGLLLVNELLKVLFLH